MRHGAPLIALLALGCAKPPDLLPMEVGRTWTYRVRSGFDTFFEPVKVVRAIPAAGTDGYELSGPLGVSRVAWKNGVLYAESASNAFFQPPLPLALLQGKEREWKGWIDAMGKRQPAKATLRQESAPLNLAGRSLSTQLAIVTIKTPKTTIELKTWYQSGVGVVQQEQRTGGKLDVATQLLSGP